MYTSVLPVIVYALMGSSRQLGVGPVAMVSLLVEVGLQGQLSEEECPAYFAQGNGTGGDENRADWVPQYDLCPDEYSHLVFMTSLLVGIFQLSAGMLRLGFLVSFLAHPVISGFTSAAAIIIGLSQLQYFFGFQIPKSQYIYETLGNLFTNLDQTKYQQLLFGLAWWFMLSMSRRLAAHPKYKKQFGWLRPSAPLLTCALAIIVGGNMEYFNGCGFTECTNTTSKLIVGKIPSGVSSMSSVQYLDFGKLSRVLTTSISCSVIGYMESIAIAKSLAAKHRYEVDAGQELIALGVANMLGSTTSAYPVTGSFSRSAVNNQVGAQTQLAGMITGLLLLFTLLALTPAFFFLPKFALAAIVIASVTNLVDYKEAMHLWKVKKTDCLLWFVAFFGTLFLGVQIGLLVSIGLSLALVILESVRPQMSVLWRLPGTPIYRNIKQESAGHFVPGVIVMRIGASMYFANVAFIRDYITRLIAEFSEAADTGELEGPGKASGTAKWVTPEPIKYIVMEMTAVISIDSTALHMLEDMHRDLKERGIHLAFSTVGNRVEDTLKRSGLIGKMGEQWIHPSVHSAVQHCIRHRISHQTSDSTGADMPSSPDGLTSTTRNGGTKGDMIHVRNVEILIDPPLSEGHSDGAPRVQKTPATIEQMVVSVPAGIMPGMAFEVNTPHGALTVTCPPDGKMGGQILVELPRAWNGAMSNGSSNGHANGGGVGLSAGPMEGAISMMSAADDGKGGPLEEAIFDHLATPSALEYRQAYQRHRQGLSSGAHGEAPLEAADGAARMPNEV